MDANTEVDKAKKQNQSSKIRMKAKMMADKM
jgi:hypothetical protein